MLRLWNGYTQDGRYSIPVGTFGAIRQWVCDNCGPIDGDPGSRCLDRGSAYQPPEYVTECPECGDFECVDDPTPRWSLKQVRRYSVRGVRA